MKPVTRALLLWLAALMAASPVMAADPGECERRLEKSTLAQGLPKFICKDSVCYIGGESGDRYDANVSQLYEQTLICLSHSAAKMTAEDDDSQTWTYIDNTNLIALMKLGYDEDAAEYQFGIACMWKEC